MISGYHENYRIYSNNIMARSIEEIKEGMTRDWMRDESVARAYGFEAGDLFSERFSRVSVENLLFYIVACAVWVLEKIFDNYRLEVEEYIEGMRPHRARWYRDKALAFMKDKTLKGDTDVYDTDGMTESEIEKAQVVKYAAATESEDASLLTVKVAGETGGVRSCLDAETFRQFGAYMQAIKDAGVRLSLVNLAADILSVEVDVYYDPMLNPERVSGGCRRRLSDYIANLPFNGEYTNMALIDCLQETEGVKIAELLWARSRAAGEREDIAINARTRPASGYFTVGEIRINMKAYV